MDIQHTSSKHVYLKTHVSRADWDELRVIFPTDAEICRRLRVAFAAAVRKVITDADEADRIFGHPATARERSERPF